MLDPNWKLDAISWKCEQLGISYGTLINQFNAHELNRVYKEYSDMLKAKQKMLRFDHDDKPQGNPPAK